MTEDTVSAASEGRSVATRESESASKPVRRRASRAAGPTSSTAPSAAGVSVEVPTAKVRTSRPAPPPRRQPNRTLVAIVALSAAFVAAAVTGLFAWLAFDGNRHMESDVARKQQFVDTASQAVVNMFSYDQNTIDESVNRFVN